MTIIPVAQRINSNKVDGTFYPLQKDELIALRQSRLIDNAAYVHLALRFSNPFCDRPIELIPKEFALAWSIPESSVYEALGKLKQKKIVDIKTGKVVISWTNNLDEEVIKGESESLEDLRNVREDSEISENSLENQNELPDPRKHSESSENQCLEVLPEIDPDSSQTIQTFSNLQTNQTEEVEEGKKHEEQTAARTNVDDEQLNQEERVIEKDEPNTSMSSLSEVLATPLEDEEDKPSPQQPKIQKQVKSVNSSNIPDDLKNKLEELEIPLDSKVLKAISSHHISQAYGAAAHVEKTWETIDNPKSIFLYQLPKQPVEQLGCRAEVKTARNFGGYTIEHIKKMYPNKWREAARYFGLEVE
jgi:hypothetical protein